MLSGLSVCLPAEIKIMFFHPISLSCRYTSKLQYPIMKMFHETLQFFHYEEQTLSAFLSSYLELLCPVLLMPSLCHHSFSRPKQLGSFSTYPTEIQMQITVGRSKSCYPFMCCYYTFSNNNTLGQVFLYITVYTYSVALVILQLQPAIRQHLKVAGRSGIEYY